MEGLGASARLWSAASRHAGRPAVQALQSLNLQSTVRHAALHSPFYRSRFQEAGVAAGSIRSAADLPLLGFFTTGRDLREDPDAFLAVPKERVVHVMSSAGTTGRSKIIFFTLRDWQRVSQSLAIGMRLEGLRCRDVVQILYCYGQPSWPTGSMIQSALERIGALIIPASNTCPIEQQLAMMRTYGTTVLISTPSYLHRLTEEGQKQLDLRSLGIRAMYLGAEPWGESLRRHLQEAWGASAYDSYGMVEMGVAGAGECAQHDGLHLMSHIVVEVVDPETGRSLAPGEEGELVITTLRREAMPLIRYRTGDIAALLPYQRCPCGIPTPKISRIKGRTDDMVCLGTGENFYPAHLERALVGIPGISGYQLVIGKEGYRDTLLLRVETDAPSDGLARQIVEGLYHAAKFVRHDVEQSETIARPRVEFVAPGTFQSRTPIKTRRIVDLRSASTPVPAGNS